MEGARQRRVLEIILLIGVWVITFDFVVGPAIDAGLPGQQPSAFHDDDPGPYPEPPDTVRGWAAIVTGGLVLAGYLLLRPRLTDDTASG